MKRLRGGLVFKACKLVYDLTLNRRVIKQKNKKKKLTFGCRRGREQATPDCYRLWLFKTAASRDELTSEQELTFGEPLSGIWRGEEEAWEGEVFGGRRACPPSLSPCLSLSLSLSPCPSLSLSLSPCLSLSVSRPVSLSISHSLPVSLALSVSLCLSSCLSLSLSPPPLSCSRTCAPRMS